MVIIKTALPTEKPDALTKAIELLLTAIPIMPLTEDFTASTFVVELIINDPSEPLPEFWLPTETSSVTCEPAQTAELGLDIANN
jgi:hypothetical protein